MRQQPGVPPTFPTWERNPNEQTSRQRYQQPPPPQGDEEEADDDACYTTRPPTSARRYQSQIDDQPARAVASVGPRRIVRYHYQDIPPRRSRTQDALRSAQPPLQPTEGQATGPQHRQTQARRRLHWLVYVGVVMLMMLMGWILLSMAFSWWQVAQDDWRYGRPRTFQTDAVVGHGDSVTHPSHFIAVNLNRRIEIIEFPGGDPTKARIYLGPTLIGQGQDLAVVTLTFQDVNGDGRPDMVVSVQDSRFVFINDHGTFRPQKPGENVHL